MSSFHSTWKSKINTLRFTKGPNVYLPYCAFQTLERYEYLYDGTQRSPQTTTMSILYMDNTKWWWEQCSADALWGKEMSRSRDLSH